MNSFPRLYEQVVEKIKLQIERGVLKPGQKVPSVRRFHRQLNVSVFTVTQAYWVLEKEGFLESRPKSGFFVRTPPLAAKNPVPKAVPALYPALSYNRIVLDMKAFAESIPVISDKSFSSFVCFPDNHSIPKALSQSIKKSWNRLGSEAYRFVFPPGNEKLRSELARHYLQCGLETAPDEILTTSGCMEAIQLCLRSVTQPGDIVAVQSPCFFGTLMTIRSLGLRIVEIPSDPETGMNLNILQKTLNRYKVKACFCMPNFSVPDTSVMPEKNKKRLVEMTNERDIPLIENDMYSDLYFGHTRPRPAKVYDKKGLVMLCASFSKTIGVGLRVGWTIPGKSLQELKGYKFLRDMTGQAATEEGVADFLANGGYQRYLRRQRKVYEKNLFHLQKAVHEHFPAGTSFEIPQGGTHLWIGLPKEVDGMTVIQQAMGQKIIAFAGPHASMGGPYKNYISLAQPKPWSEKTEAAVKTLGDLTKKQTTETKKLAHHS
jgi:DNA-binding transcriptional MocR family regulator